MYKKSTTCAECGLKGRFFALEKDKHVNTNKYHLNLYGIKNNKEILFTKDHIIPLSRNGKNELKNYNTMCYFCNLNKKDKIKGK